MKKVEMAQRIATAMAITKEQADAAVEAILTAVKDALRQGEAVTLRGVGTWQVRAKRARVDGAQAGVDARNGRPGAAESILSIGFNGLNMQSDNAKVDGFKIVNAAGSANGLINSTSNAESPKPSTTQRRRP